MAASRRSALSVAMRPSFRGRPLDRLLPGQRVEPAPDLLDDGVRVGGPHERLGALIMLLDEAIDRLLEGHERWETPALEASPAQPGEEGLDRVEPGAGGRGEMEGPARM